MDIIGNIQCETPGERAMLLAALKWVALKPNSETNAEVGELWPPIEDWADMAGVGLSSAKKYLQRLRERGIIREKGGQEQSPPRGGRGRTTHYIIVPIAKGLPERPFSTTDRQAERVSHVDPFPTERVSHVDPFPTERVSVGDEKGLCGRFPSIEEPSSEPSRALERSQTNSDLERSGAGKVRTPARTSDEDQRPLTGKDTEPKLTIVGLLSQRSDIAGTAKVREWRKGQIQQLLRRGLKPLIEAGRIKDPRGVVKSSLDVEADIRRISEHGNVTPALVEIALNRLREADRPDAPIGNPVGYLINALGANKRGNPLEPYESDQAILDLWQDCERQLLGSDQALRNIAQRLTPPEPKTSPGSTFSAGQRMLERMLDPTAATSATAAAAFQ